MGFANCLPPNASQISKQAFHMICQKNPSIFEDSWHYLINMKVFWTIFKEFYFFCAQPIYLFQR
jgi:hypothetical protein